MPRTPGLPTTRLLLSVLLLAPLCLAAKKKDQPANQTVMVKLPAPPKLKQIQGDDRSLHALDRLTFGPRPGEVDEVKAIGLDAWIAQQLHPTTIDDANMEQRLAQFPAMHLSEEDLTRKFPPGSDSSSTGAGKRPGAREVAADPPPALAQAHQIAGREAALTAGLLFGSPDFQRR